MTNYKKLYESVKYTLMVYQDELVPGLRSKIAELEADNERLRNMWAMEVSRSSELDAELQQLKRAIRDDDML
jgi:hypothetical protein